MTFLIALLILPVAGVVRLGRYIQRRRAEAARADAVIDAFLRDRFAGNGRTREVHGLTVPQLLDLVDIELDLDADEDLRSRIDELNDKFPQT